MNATTHISTNPAAVRPVKLKGRLDAASVEKNAGSIRQSVLSCNGSVVLNLAELSFIDSTGLGFLVSLHRLLDKKGHTLAICEANAQSRLLFELTRLNQVFDLYDTEAMAVGAMA